MRKDFRFGGAGGQGVISLAVLLANAYGVQNNYEVAQTQSYGPAARGGACKAELVVSDRRIDYVKATSLTALWLSTSPALTNSKAIFSRHKALCRQHFYKQRRCRGLRHRENIHVPGYPLCRGKLSGSLHKHSNDGLFCGQESGYQPGRRRESPAGSDEPQGAGNEPSGA